MKCVVLTVVDHEHTMSTYAPQVATIQEYDSMEQAAAFNVSVPRGKEDHAVRTVVIPAEHWFEYEVYRETQKGISRPVAYSSENPTMTEPSE